jgi:hypothetical protein
VDAITFSPFELTSIKLNYPNLFCCAINIDHGEECFFFVRNFFSARTLVFAIDDEMHFGLVLVVGRG